MRSARVSQVRHPVRWVSSHPVRTKVRLRSSRINLFASNMRSHKPATAMRRKIQPTIFRRTERSSGGGSASAAVPSGTAPPGEVSYLQCMAARGNIVQLASAGGYYDGYSYPYPYSYGYGYPYYGGLITGWGWGGWYGWGWRHGGWGYGYWGRGGWGHGGWGRGGWGHGGWGHGGWGHGGWGHGGGGGHR